jgi:acyl-CoA thioester hydrolase
LTIDKKTENNVFIWSSEVRSYEIDYQGIVNNALYFSYFDQTRVGHFAALGINWFDLHDKDIDAVLIHVDMSIKAPLSMFDKFYVTSKIKRSGRLRIIFHQKIFKTLGDILVSESTNTVVCVSRKTKKPIMPKEVESLIFNIQSEDHDPISQ